MRKVCLSFLVCFVTGCFFQGIPGQYSCEWRGFRGCECNIMGACFKTGKPKPGLDDKFTSYSPYGLDQFGYTKSKRNPSNLAYLCESNTVAILYDCNARIPLYAAIMMTGAQPKARFDPPPSRAFRRSGDSKLSQQFQQENDDYDRALERNICYERRGRAGAGDYLVDVDWLRAYSHVTASWRQPCVSSFIIKSAVNRGHLIAAHYGRGDSAKIRATFSFSNAVPQFGTFNSGKWNSCERRLITWGRKNCNLYNGKQTQNARMYVVVGAIPSTFRPLKPRFFGNAGFSNFQGKSTRPSTKNMDYRVNVPRFMWTAACCTFQYKDGRGKLKDATRNTAFYRENDPGKKSCDTPGNLGSLFRSMGLGHLAVIDLFPGSHFKCYDSFNYVSIK